MPARSKAQMRFMGAVLRCKKDRKCPSKEIKEAAKSMSLKEIQDFLTPQTGLPEIVTKANLMEFLIRLANEMDSRGLIKEANLLEDLIKSL